MNFEVIKRKMDDDANQDGQNLEFQKKFLHHHNGVLKSIHKKHRKQMMVLIIGNSLTFGVVFLDIIKIESSVNKLVWFWAGFIIVIKCMMELYLYKRITKFTKGSDSSTKMNILEQIIHLKELDDYSRFLHINFSIIVPFLIVSAYTLVITSRESLTNEEVYTQLVHFERPILELIVLIGLILGLTFLWIFDGFNSNRDYSYRRELSRLKQLLLSI